MFAIISSLRLLFAIFSILTSAVPVLSRKDTCTAAPATFTISNFNSFYPATGNINPSVTSFRFGDSSTTSTVQCTISGAHVPVTFTPCSNPAVSFRFGGTQQSNGYLNVTQQIEGCDSPVHGSVFISTFCFPAQVPFGPGTDCEIPTVSLTGEFRS